MSALYAFLTSQRKTLLYRSGQSAVTRNCISQRPLCAWSLYQFAAKNAETRGKKIDKCLMLIRPCVMLYISVPTTISLSGNTNTCTALMYAVGHLKTHTILWGNRTRHNHVRFRWIWGTYPQYPPTHLWMTPLRR